MNETTTPPTTTAPTAAGPLFPLGQVVMTPGVCDSGLTIPQLNTLIRRHLRGEWDMDADDVAANMHAIGAGGRVFGAFTVGAALRIWIITESDRAHTCVLLPSEY